MHCVRSEQNKSKFSDDVGSICAKCYGILEHKYPSITHDCGVSCRQHDNKTREPSVFPAISNSTAGACPSPAALPANTMISAFISFWKCSRTGWIDWACRSLFGVSGNCYVTSAFLDHQMLLRKVCAAYLGLGPLHAGGLRDRVRLVDLLLYLHSVASGSLQQHIIIRPRCRYC